MVEIICEWCHQTKEFPSRCKNGNPRRFCSKRCYGDWKHSIQPMLKGKCLNCGKKFSRPVSMNRNKSGLINCFCGSSCARSYVAKDRMSHECTDIEKAWQLLDESTKGWIAGMIDGEGHLGISINKGGYCIRVDIANTAQIVPEFLDSVLPHGHVHTRKEREEWKTCYRWDYYGYKAIAFCKLLAPYLKIKREQAILISKIDMTDKWTVLIDSVDIKSLNHRKSNRLPS